MACICLPNQVMWNRWPMQRTVSEGTRTPRFATRSASSLVFFAVPSPEVTNNGNDRWRALSSAAPTAGSGDNLRVSWNIVGKALELLFSNYGWWWKELLHPWMRQLFSKKRDVSYVSLPKPRTDDEWWGRLIAAISHWDKAFNPDAAKICSVYFEANQLLFQGKYMFKLHIR